MSRRYRSSGQTVIPRRLKVLVDMDQVVCDFESRFLEAFREKYPNDPFIPVKERTVFYIADQYEQFGEEAVVGFKKRFYF